MANFLQSLWRDFTDDHLKSAVLFFIRVKDKIFVQLLIVRDRPNIGRLVNTASHSELYITRKFALYLGGRYHGLHNAGIRVCATDTFD